MREKLYKFMEGRYGNDQFNRFLMIAVFTCFFISIFFDDALYYIAIALLIYAYYRMFSKDYTRRYKENEAYLRFSKKVKGLFGDNKTLFNKSKSHKIYKCPSCNQKLRIPKGKGKVSIHCPNCKVDFIKRS